MAVKKQKGRPNTRIEITPTPYNDLAESYEVSVFELARCMDTEEMAGLLENYLNQGGKGFRSGEEDGRALRYAHRTLQRLVVAWALGVICGLSEQEYTDPRNETAIKTAKWIKRLCDKGELPLGMFI